MLLAPESTRTLPGLSASRIAATHQQPPGNFQTSDRPKNRPTEPLGVAVLQTDEGPAADEEDVGRVEGQGGAGCRRRMKLPTGGTVATVRCKILSKVS
jgi:hypothetical protein